MDRCPKCGWHHTNECMGENMVANHNPAIPRTRTPILISAMRLLARDIQSEDGVANAAIAEAGNRLADLEEELERSNKFLDDAEARITELEKERADILRLAGECYTPVSLAAHVGSTRWDWEQAHKLLDAAGVPDNLTLGDRIQALLNR